MRYWILGGLAVVVAGAGFLFFNRRVEADIFPLERQFQISYNADLSALPKDALNVRIWIPLAANREGQEILERKIEAPGAYQVTQDPVFGNEMLYFEAKGGLPEKINFKIDYRVKVNKNGFYALNNKDENTSVYLKPTRFMKITEEVERKVKEATNDKQGFREKVRGIYDYVIGNMEYDKLTPGWGKGDTLRACLMGKGNCTDFHSLFISMAQATNIPARFKIGFTVPNEEEGVIPGYHCWAEFYEEGRGWRPIDASDAWKHPERKEAYFGNFDTNKFTVSMGRDLKLAPPQSGGPVNIFFYPYVEVDGKAFDGFKTSFNYKNE